MVYQEIPETFKRKYILITVVAVLVYLLTAFLSEGYYHPDEHFQILEFANFKRGLTAAYKLPWEYREQIRSSFQPWIVFSIIRILQFIGIENPHIYVLLLRSITAILSIYAINRFYLNNFKQFNSNYWTVYLLFSYFLWFLPFINVRFSGETWSGLLFLMALCNISIYDKLDYRTAMKIGILCGMSFLCRFQSGIMISSLWAWLIIFKRTEIKLLIAGGTVCFMIILIGIYFDRLFYDSWTLTPLNYFKANIIEDVASHFGTMTWYEYILSIIVESVLPIGIIIICAIIIALVFYRSSLVIWCVAPLLIVHMIIPHKEIRFMFPLVNLIPLLLMLMIAKLEVLRDKIEFKKFIFPMFALFLGVVNIIALVTAVCSKSHNGRIAITHYVYNHFRNASPNIYSFKGNDPFLPYPIIYQSFYQIAGVKHITLNNYYTLTEEQFNSAPPGLLIIRKKDLLDQKFSNLVQILHLRNANAGNFEWVSQIKSFYYGGNYYNNEYILFTSQ